MRILQIISGLDIGRAHGGAERFGLELACWLTRQGGSQVELCAFWQHDTPAEQFWLQKLRDSGVPVFFAATWPGQTTLRAYLQALRHLRRRFPHGSLDLAHSHFQLGTIAALYLKGSKSACRALRTTHITQEWGIGWQSALARLAFTNGLFPLFLDAETGVSQAVVDRLARRPLARLARKTPRLVYNAIPLEEFEEQLNHAGGWEEPAGTAGKEPVTNASSPVHRIGSIGRVTTQKDYETLVQAAARVLAEVPGAFFQVIGEGELRPDLETLAQQMGISHSFQFLGPRDDVASFLKSLDLFVLPSRWEGLPTVVIESMVAGVPVIATDIPGTRELIDESRSGWLVPPGDPQALGQAILYALRNPEQATDCARQAAVGVRQFSMSAVGEQYLELYKEIGTRC